MLLHESPFVRLEVMRGLVVRFDFPYPICADPWIENAFWLEMRFVKAFKFPTLACIRQFVACMVKIA